MSALLLVLSAIAAEPPPAEPAREPIGILKVGIGLPGVPAFGAEFFLNDWSSVALEGGVSGPLGPYASASWRYRPCWGCGEGAGFALGIGPEVETLPRSEASRVGLYVTGAVEPALVVSVREPWAWTLGLKAAFGKGWEWERSASGELTPYDQLPGEIVNFFLLSTGVQF